MWLANQNTQENYNLIVNDCLVNEASFNTFKSNNNYNSIVGMSEVWQGEFWIEDIINNNPEVLMKIPKISLNDRYGSPINWSYKNGIVLSANTARYVNSALQIIRHFKFKDSINVTELGVGYGGLCYIVNCLLDVKNYALIDMPNVQELAQKYLRNLNVTNTQKNKIEDNDLFISEFCLSEFDDKDIYDFYNTYVVNSKYVFLQMNLDDKDRKSNFIKTIEKDFDIEIRDEVPKTRWDNYVILGVKK